MLFGSLSPVVGTTKPELLAPSVLQAILTSPEKDRILVSEIDPTLSDTTAYCEKYNFPLNRAANCIVLKAKRADRTWFAVCVVLATTRADINGIVKERLDARKVSFAPMEEAVSETGMEFGAITPIGVPVGWSVLVDSEVVSKEYVTIGSGVRRSKLFIPGGTLATFPNVEIVEGLGTMRTTQNKA